MEIMTNSIPSRRPFSPVAQWLSPLIARFPTLTYSALAMLAAFGLSLLLMLVDERTVLGINTWVKPAKFYLSTGIYLLTMSWLFTQIQSWKPQRVRRWSLWLAWLLNLEIALITLQGARGVPSHFNGDTPFDLGIFALMGILILSATIVMGRVLWTMWTKPFPHLSRPLRWALRLGLLLFMLASFEGGFMSQYGAHSVGVPDGGPGLPFLNWSTEGGDLRIAHFFGLHGLQLFPLLAFALKKRNFPVQTPIVVSVATLYTLLSLGTFAWAVLQ